MKRKDKGKLATKAAGLPRRKGGKRAGATTRTQDTTRAIGVSAESPSPAWVRMVERARGGKGETVETIHHRPRPDPGQGAMFSVKDKPLHPIEDPRLKEWHVTTGCPYCIAPGYIQGAGWPARCKVRVSEGVECADTASAAEIGHHYDCPFWDHTDGVPF